MRGFLGEWRKCRGGWKKDSLQVRIHVSQFFKKILCTEEPQATYNNCFFESPVITHIAGNYNRYVVEGKPI